jgi:hypothetical protein
LNTVLNLEAHKMEVISWIARELLACQEELCSMESAVTLIVTEVVITVAILI